MKIMAPDDPTAVYPIGSLIDEEEEDDEVLAEPSAPKAVPPLEASVTSEEPLEADPTNAGGFNPMVAVAVLLAGGALAAILVGAVTLLLLLGQ